MNSTDRKVNAQRHERLRIDLKKLDTELRDVKSIEAADRELLLRIQGDIAAALKRENQVEPQYNGLTERLHEAVARLEATHPRITLLMREAIDSLAYLGI